MEKIIVTTPDELKELIWGILDEYFQEKGMIGGGAKETTPESMTLDQAVIFLKENGYPTSKATIYKLTSANKIPYKKYNNKLVFSREQLLAWASSRAVELSGNENEAISYVQREALKKK